MRTRLLVGGVVALLPVALIPIGWWLVGDQTEGMVRHEPDLMYLVQPPRWSHQVDQLVLAASAAVVALLVVVLVLTVRRSRPTSVGLLLAAAALVIGIAWGWLGRTLTIGAHGANMSVLVLPLAPVILFVQVYLAVFAGWIVEPTRRAAPRSTEAQPAVR